MYNKNINMIINMFNNHIIYTQNLKSVKALKL